jgi:hypothetical protein
VAYALIVQLRGFSDKYRFRLGFAVGDVIRVDDLQAHRVERILESRETG